MVSRVMKGHVLYMSLRAIRSGWLISPRLVMGDATCAVAASGAAPCQASSPWNISASANPAQAAYQTTYGYDEAGNLTLEQAPAAPTYYAYDAIGRMTTAETLEGITSFTYENSGKPITIGSVPEPAPPTGRRWRWREGRTVLSPGSRARTCSRWATCAPRRTWRLW